MKRLPNLRRYHYLARFSSLLIVAALIVGAVGCPPPVVQYELTISSTDGGSVMAPGEGILISRNSRDTIPIRANHSR